MFRNVVRLLSILSLEGPGAAAAAVTRYRRNRRYGAHGNVYQALVRGRVASAAGIVTDRFVGTNLYKEWLRWRHGNPVRLRVNSYEMYVDLDEPGLHDDLLSYREREVNSTRAFAAALRAVRASTDGPVTVLDVGAHIGYFALLEASVLGERADVHAFEPVPANFEVLRRNVELNGFGGRFTLNRAAVGSERGTAEVALAVHSNQSYVPSEHIVTGGTTLTGERASVEQRSLDAYLAARGIAPEAVDVLRMDLQGGEYDVLAGARSILDADSDLVLFVETHPENLGPERQTELVRWLADAGFEPVHTARGFRTPESHPELRVASIDDLRDTNAEVVLRRRRSRKCRSNAMVDTPEE